MRRKPKAEKVSKSTTETVWLIRWPSSATKGGGKCYYARELKSGGILVETGAKRNPASELVSQKLTPTILAAIEVAKEVAKSTPAKRK